MKIRGEQSELEEERESIETTLGSKARLKTLVKKELQADAETYGDERRSKQVAREAAQALMEEETLPLEPLTIVLSKSGWVRLGKGHDIDAPALNYRAGDEFQDAARGRSNEQAVFLDSSGRAYALPAHSLPSARGLGEPLTSRFSLPPGARFIAALAGARVWRCADRYVCGGVLRVVLVAVMLSASGCIVEPALRKDKELKDLIDTYRQRSAAIEEQRKSREEAAIRKLEVARDPAGRSFVVSVDLKDALVSRVVDRILEATSEPYNFAGVRLNGRATARFDRLPLVRALNQLVNPRGVSAGLQDGVLVFRQGGAIEPAAAGWSSSPESDAEGSSDVVSPDETHYEEVPLRHLDSADAMNLLQELYGISDDEEEEDGVPSLIKFGALEELNVVFVSGLRRDVLNAIGVLNRADREVSQVLIEALVVELDITAAVELGSRLSDGASGNFSGITFSPGDVGGNIGFSFLEGASNFVQFTALINLLISQDKAQVLSRPYLSARSSQEAVVEIANDRTIRIDQTFEGAAIASTDTITAGVRLQVKPTVLADEQIRIDLQVEESQFVPTLGVALVEKDRNSAQTAVTVRSGQTIVVGGLNLRRIISLNSGIPWLRRIPLLNLLTAQQGSFDQSKEVVVYLTPYIWDPGVDTPLARSGAFGPQGEIFTDFERFKVITPEEDTEHE